MAASKNFTFSFNFKCSDITEQKALSNTEVHHGIPWQMYLTEKEDYLGFFLYCNLATEYAKWSIKANWDVILKAKTGKDSVTSFKACFHNQDQDGLTTNWGQRKLYHIDDIRKKYLVNDELRFTVEMKTLEMFDIDPQLIEMSAPKELLFTHVFEDIHDLYAHGHYVYSDTVTLLGIPWKIRLNRHGTHFNFLLHCCLPPHNWSIHTEWSIRVASKNGNDLFGKWNDCFQNKEQIPPTYSRRFFCEGDRLENELLDNGTLKINATLRISRMVGIDLKKLQLPTIPKKFVLTHGFKDVSGFKRYETSYSNVKEHFGVPWKMCVTREAKHIYGKDYLGFYLYCNLPDGGLKWACSIESEIELTSKTGPNVIKKLNEQFRSQYYNELFGRWINLCEWSKLEDYIIDGLLTVKIKVRIVGMYGIKQRKLRNFDEETMKNESDTILVVDDEKFYVAKSRLTSFSPFFESLNSKSYEESKNEKAKTTADKEPTEIVLPDVNRDEFQKFLELIYGYPSINDDTVEAILNLAEKFEATKLIQACEKFLIDRSKKTQEDKLQLAKLYNLDKLQLKH